MSRTKEDDHLSKRERHMLVIIACFAFLFLSFNAEIQQFFNAAVIYPTEQEAPLFDVTLNIPKMYQGIHPGDELLSVLELKNLGSKEREDVILRYTILDPQKNILLEQGETVAVHTQQNFVRSFIIPSSFQPGKYYLRATVTYFNGERYATADVPFDVYAPSQTIIQSPNLISTIILGMLLTVLILSIINSHNIRKFHHK